MITIIEPTDKSAMPEIPFPLVHPSAIRAPKSIINPPQNAMRDRLDNVAIDVAFVQIGEKLDLLVLAKDEEMYAPKNIPKIRPNCHQCFSIGKHEV